MCVDFLSRLFFINIMQPNQKHGQIKVKLVKSQKVLAPGSVIKTSCKKGKEKGKQKSLNRKKKKQTDTSLEEEQNQVDERRNEYYNKEKREAKGRFPNGSTNLSEYISVTSTGKGTQRGEGTSGSMTKLNLDKVKGVISFDGKYIKNNVEPPSHRSPANWEFSSDNYTQILSRQEPPRLTNKKIKSKSKSRKKLNQPKPKGKDTSQNKERHSSSRNMIKRTPNTDGETFIDSTKSTPVQSITYERKQEVDFQAVMSELQDDKSKMLKINLLKKVSSEKRSQCINMVSRICGQMQFHKQVFSLSIKLFDSYLNDQVLISKHKLLALACLFLSLKLEEAEIANIFYVQLSAINSKLDENQKENHKVVEGARSPKSLGKEKLKKKKDKDKEKGKDYQNEKKQEKTNIIFERFKILKKILQEQMEEGVNKTELFEFQTMILIKEDFRVCKRTYCFWVDTLTMIWDQFIIGCQDNYGSLDCLLFRCLGRTKNFAFLNQIIESSTHTTQFYAFTPAVIVTSTMYLLIRINMEGEEEGFENYRKNLQKSSNVLFVDRAGVNEVFGEFISKIEMEMGQILPCCQFLSSFLNQQIFIDFNYEGVSTAPKFDHTLGYHYHNPKIYTPQSF